MFRPVQPEALQNLVGKCTVHHATHNFIYDAIASVAIKVLGGVIGSATLYGMKAMKCGTQAVQCSKD